MIVAKADTWAMSCLFGNNAFLVKERACGAVVGKKMKIL